MLQIYMIIFKLWDIEKLNLPQGTLPSLLEKTERFQLYMGSYSMLTQL